MKLVPFVSIITPTFNHVKYIRKCIKSVISQTYNNWEMIIVDDCSTDGTAKIISEYMKTDKRIRTIRHKFNKGINNLAKSNNEALKIARGKYIAILEGDDFWPKDKLELQLRSFKDKNVVLSFGNCIFTDTKGLPIKLHAFRQYKNADLNNTPTGSVLNAYSDLNFSIIPVTVMIDKYSLISIGGFSSDTDYPFVDIPTFLKLSLKGKFNFMNEILGYYRKNEYSEWFKFARNSTSMGRSELSRCYKSFLRRNQYNVAAIKLLKNKIVRNSQNKIIEHKKRFRYLSILLNNLAFKISPNPLYLVFCYQFIQYKIEKKLALLE